MSTGLKIEGSETPEKIVVLESSVALSGQQKIEKIRGIQFPTCRFSRLQRMTEEAQEPFARLEKPFEGAQ
jgi:hypothetical protein